MKKVSVVRRSQWCLPWIIFMGILMVNPSLSNAGNISSTDKYAWSENAGWMNFNSTYGSVTVYSSYLEGYIWAENIGWIKLGNGAGGPYNNTSSSDWGVNNDGSGNLSGYAWSENAGWINFNPTHSQVTINTNTGSFEGYAWGENIGWVHFKNTSPAYNVVTTWAPPSGGGGVFLALLCGWEFESRHNQQKGTHPYMAILYCDRNSDLLRRFGTISARADTLLTSRYSVI